MPRCSCTNPPSFRRRPHCRHGRRRVGEEPFQTFTNRDPSAARAEPGHRVPNRTHPPPGGDSYRPRYQQARSRAALRPVKQRRRVGAGPSDPRLVGRLIQGFKGPPSLNVRQHLGRRCRPRNPSRCMPPRWRWSAESTATAASRWREWSSRQSMTHKVVLSERLTWVA
jgi:hypothetical protein